MELEIVTLNKISQAQKGIMWNLDVNAHTPHGDPL